MFEARLNQARKGRGILFCGAGFSADCLNFTDDAEIGVGAHLLAFLNKELEKSGEDAGYKDLRNAADAANDALGEHGLMALLQARFKIENVTTDMVEILSFPWERIYTTNYDDAIEKSLDRAKINYRHINNTDAVVDLDDGKSNVIYLHGRAKAWNINNFTRSCVLGADSYSKLGFLDDWLELFRRDLDRSEIVIFIGFNASDFHLNQVLNNIAGIRDKVYFINRPSALPDVDVKRTQKKFGTPLYIGRQGLASTMREVLAQDRPIEPSLSSFSKFVRHEAASSVPETKSIEDLFVFGIISDSDLYRDVDNDISDYHVKRSISEEILNDISLSTNILLIIGDICDGKTIIIKELSRRLDVERSVFVMGLPYDDILDEVAKVLEAYPTAVFVVENCFELSRERLLSMARMLSATSAALILTSRTIGAEARAQDIESLKNLQNFREYRLPALSQKEVAITSALADQIAGWSDFKSKNNSDKEKFISISCNGSLPSFLLRLLRSEYVRGKYKEEYNKLGDLSGAQLKALVGALYIAHIGEKPHVGFLSDVFGFDVGDMISRLERKPAGLRLFRISGGVIETVPAIGATNILREVVPDKIIVNSVAEVMGRLSESNFRDDYRRHTFSQMMRYSIIHPIIVDDKWISRFFDNMAKIDYVRRQVLFWLQWSIALREKNEFVDAEKTLEQGYREAEAYEKRVGKVFDRRQLDDVKAKLLMARARKNNLDAPQLFRDMKSACEIVGRLLREADLTHHPFETLRSIAELFGDKGYTLEGSLRNLAYQNLAGIIKLAEKRIGNVPAGYQTFVAVEALKNASSLISAPS